MSARRTTIAMAIRLRSSRLRASAHGLAPTAASSPAEAGGSPTIVPVIVPLLHPALGHEPVERLSEREVADPPRHEVDVLRCEQRRHGRRVSDLLVDLRPHLVRSGLVLDRSLERLLHLEVDLLVTEAGDVDAR